MSFQQALSGLNASSAQLDTIGNNVANSGTVGFKQSAAHFADIFAASMQGGGAAPIGIGSTVAAVAQQFTQGNLTTTNNPLDVALNGGGFFRMDNNGTFTYTRNGQFQLDKSGYIVNDGGQQLTGYAADPITGIIVPGQTGPLQVNNNAIAPAVTTLSQVQVNLDSRAIPPVSMTSGSTTGSAPPTAAMLAPNPFVSGAPDFTITVDGLGPYNVSIANNPAGYTPSTLVVAMQAAINTALAGTNSSATVSLVAPGNDLQITSGSVGTIGSQGLGSSVAVGAGANLVALFGAVPTTVAGVDNFSVTSANSFTASTAQTIYDTLGDPHTMSLYYVKTSEPAHWQMYTALDGVLSAPGTPVNLTFSTTGLLQVPAAGTLLAQTFPVNTGATNPLAFNLDLTGTTQYGIPFGTNQLIQDGYTSGKLSGLTISSDGIIQGRYSNGKSKNMGQIVLANFDNPNGLQNLGNNQWAETNTAGSAIPGTPGTGNLGLVQSGAVEESNVDMTAELVNMITAQRAYQANAQTIKTQDQIMQTLVNLR